MTLKPYYQDGACTIYNGDCREILPQLEKVDLVLTDPPYGHNNNNGDLASLWEAALGRGEAGPARPIANDGEKEARELVHFLFKEAARILPPGSCCCCCCCCCCGGGPDPQFARWSLWLDEYLNFKQMVIWDKGPMGMGWHYRRSYECVLVAEKPGAACKWYGGSNTENIIRPSPSINKIIPSAVDHPTPKPTALMAHFIRLHTKEGEVVLDPFMGGGTTLVAAKQLGRKGLGIELEEKYCEMAVKRLRQEILIIDRGGKEAA